MTRLQPDAKFWSLPQSQRPIVSLSALAASEADQRSWWRDYAREPFFNGTGERLPPFLQNLLPEGPLRLHLAQLRGCQPDDHFDLLAMCGSDLPGNLYALPATLGRDAVARLVTQNHDALEMSVVATAVAQATSLSGVQPKLSVVLRGGRYVARTKDAAGVHLIAKLPTAEFALLPEVEALSLQLAGACGVAVCEARLAPMAELDADAPFVVREERSFLAVTRFDRAAGRRHLHAETFGQVLGVDPQSKYHGGSYALMAQVMLDTPGLGESAALELVRRLAVNELLGNYDAHLLNFALLYADPLAARLAPAYDVVAYAAYLSGHGHGLPFYDAAEPRQRLGPASVRGFSQQAGLLETLVQGAVRSVVKKASATWPALIASSALFDTQKTKLLKHLDSHPLINGYRARSGRAELPP